MVEEKKEEKKRSKAKSAEASDEGGKKDKKKADQKKASADEKSEKGKKEEKAPVKLSKKAQDILKAVEEMSVIELNELVKALEEKFGVSAAPLSGAPAAAPAGAAGAEGTGAAPAEKSEYDVILAGIGENKIAAIKAVREINQELGLKEAKELVESVPKPVAEGVKKDDAEEAKKKLEAAGCKVELK